MLIEDGIYLAALPIDDPLETINCYLLVDRDDAYLVDTGWWHGADHEHVLALLEMAKVVPSRLSGIVLTHAHRDHAGHLGLLQDLTGAPVLMHEAERTFYESLFGDVRVSPDATIAWLETHGTPRDVAEVMVASQPVLPAMPARSPRSLWQGDVLPVGRMRWEVLATPGHSPGHICLLERQRGILITGDHVLPNETPNVSVRPNLPSNPLGRYIASLVEVQSLPVRLALPGHGQAFGDLATLVPTLIRHHDLRFNDVLETLRTMGPQSTFGIASAIPWVQRSKRFADLEGWHKFLAFGEAIAHLESLEARAIVGRVQREQTLIWVLTNNR